MGSVLYIAAHPDDENTLLIAYLARGRNYRTAYLSLTRGDGGQNVLGPEFGEELGVARTQELLAARRLDGGRQFFTRAIDFGFSKDYRETLNIWDKQQVLSDVVRVIREFRPDVVIVRFSPEPGGTHGHHTASTVLALEAFKLAGDTNAFPDQLATWRRGNPNAFSGMPVDSSAAEAEPMPFGWKSAAMTRFPGNRLPKLPRAAAPCTRPRALTISVALAAVADQGPSHSRPWTANLRPTTSWMVWIPRGTACPAALRSGNWRMKSSPNSIRRNPSASVPALLKLRSQLAALPTTDPVVIEKRAQLDRILQACLGLEVETVIPQAEVVPGESLKCTIPPSCVPVFRSAGWACAIPESANSPTPWSCTADQPVVAEFSANAARQHAAESAVLAARRRHAGHVPRG